MFLKRKNMIHILMKGIKISNFFYNKNRIKRLNLYKIMVSLNRGQ